MSKVRLSVTEQGMSQVEALEAIRAATDHVSITVEDCARASGLSKTTITDQAREDAKTGGCELGFYGIIANSRVSIIRTSFLNFIDHGRGGETA